jgi:hypothetical protein
MTMQRAEVAMAPVARSSALVVVGSMFTVLGVRRALPSERIGVAMRINEDVLHCVAFVGCNLGQGEQGIKHNLGGTGFFIALPAEGRANSFFQFFVTARHVAERIPPEKLILRVNKKEGGAGAILGNHATRWWMHPTDHSADVAVAPLSPSKEFDIRSLTPVHFVTKELIDQKRVAVGDEVTVVGMFARHAGRKINETIVRTGTVAMLPTETVPTKIGEIDAYLVEVRSIGGLSGSPVFVRETLELPYPLAPGQFTLHGQSQLRLLGLVHGHWDLPADPYEDDSLDPERKVAANMGISIVVPARKILETIDQPDLKAERDAVLAAKSREPQ